MEPPAARKPRAQDRVTINDIWRWQELRASHDQFAASHPFNATHQLKHINKALGFICMRLEHEDHEELYDEVEQKRYADLIIHAVWMATCHGHDPGDIVLQRMIELGLAPKHYELPSTERPAAVPTVGVGKLEESK